MPISSTLKKVPFSPSLQGGSIPQQSRNHEKYALKIIPANHDKIKIAKSAYCLENQDQSPKTNHSTPTLHFPP
jgi:hypothetical protein